MIGPASAVLACTLLIERSIDVVRRYPDSPADYALELSRYRGRELRAALELAELCDDYHVRKLVEAGRALGRERARETTRHVKRLLRREAKGQTT